MAPTALGGALGIGCSRGAGDQTGTAREVPASPAMGVALVNDEVKYCAFDGCNAVIEPVPGRPERRYCSPAHRAAARQARRAAARRAQAERLAETLPWLREPEQVVAASSDRRASVDHASSRLLHSGVARSAPPPAVRAEPRAPAHVERVRRKPMRISRRRRALAVLGVAGVLAGGYAVTASDRPLPQTPPVQTTPVPSEDEWAAQARVALTSVERQLDALAQTEEEWRRLAENRSPGPVSPPKPVREMRERKTLLERKRATLQSQLDAYRSLKESESQLEATEQQLRSVERALQDVPPQPRRNNEHASTIAALMEQRDLRIRQRDVKRQEVETLRRSMEAARQVVLADDSAKTAEVSNKVREIIRNGGKSPDEDNNTSTLPRRPDAVTGRNQDSKSRRTTDSDGSPNPRGSRDSRGAQRTTTPRQTADPKARVLGQVTETLENLLGETRKRTTKPERDTATRKRKSRPLVEDKDTERSEADRKTDGTRRDRRAVELDEISDVVDGVLGAVSGDERDGRDQAEKQRGKQRDRDEPDESRDSRERGKRAEASAAETDRSVDGLKRAGAAQRRLRGSDEDIEAGAAAPDKRRQSAERGNAERHGALSEAAKAVGTTVTGALTAVSGKRSDKADERRGADRAEQKRGKTGVGASTKLIGEGALSPSNPSGARADGTSHSDRDDKQRRSERASDHARQHGVANRMNLVGANRPENRPDGVRQNNESGAQAEAEKRSQADKRSDADKRGGADQRAGSDQRAESGQRSGADKRIEAGKRSEFDKQRAENRDNRPGAIAPLAAATSGGVRAASVESGAQQTHTANRPAVTKGASSWQPRHGKNGSRPQLTAEQKESLRRLWSQFAEAAKQFERVKKGSPRWTQAGQGKPRIQHNGDRPPKVSAPQSRHGGTPSVPKAGQQANGGSNTGSTQGAHMSGGTPSVQQLPGAQSAAQATPVGGKAPAVKPAGQHKPSTGQQATTTGQQKPPPAQRNGSSGQAGQPNVGARPSGKAALQRQWQQNAGQNNAGQNNGAQKGAAVAKPLGATVAKNTNPTATRSVGATTAPPKQTSVGAQSA